MGVITKALAVTILGGMFIEAGQLLASGQKEVYYPIKPDAPYVIQKPQQSKPYGPYLRKPILPGQQVTVPLTATSKNTPRKASAAKPQWKETKLSFGAKKIGGQLKKPRVDLDADQPEIMLNHDINMVDFMERFEHNSPSPFID